MAEVPADVQLALEAVDEHFADVWWTCGICHRTFPRDFASDYCPDHDVRLRRNDDIRIARADVMRRNRTAAS